MPPSPEDSMGPLAKLRSARRDKTLERLEEGYAKVVNVIEAIHTHLEHQDDRTKAMAESMERLAANMANMPETSNTQVELLTSLNRQVEADVACSRRLEENLAQLPKIADAQRETMIGIRRQLDDSRASGEKLSTTLDGFKQSVSELSEAATASGEAVRGMEASSASREERLAELFEQQAKRLTLFATVGIVVAVLIAIMGLVALVR